MKEQNEENQDLAPIRLIRAETILSRLPIHQLSKKGTHFIELNQKSPKGLLITNWDVSYNSTYGPPRQLSYKLDTLLVNRRIDEERTKDETGKASVPEIIKLDDSLAEIAKQFDCGKDTNTVKNALLQNASAFIRTKLEYRSNEGKSRKFEFGDTRYGIIFVGEELPDGTKSDGVYIVLHRLFRELLKYAPIRPLDYAYLKELTPSAQRLYELVSFQIFAALEKGNPRAKFLYSELCTFAPLTRYFEWEQVKKQLHKLHAPHKAAKYFAKVEFEKFLDEEEKNDWIIYYTPGAKARAEYRASKTKPLDDGPLQQNLPLADVSTAIIQGKRKTTTGQQASKTVSQHTSKAVTVDKESLLSNLLGCGITRKDAEDCVTNFAEVAAEWAEAVEGGHIDRTKVRNLGAWLLSAIRGGWARPEAYYKTKARAEEKRRESAAREAQEHQERLRNEHAQRWKKDYYRFCKKRLSEIEASYPRQWEDFLDSENRRRAFILKTGSSRLIAEHDSEELYIGRAFTHFTAIDECNLPDFWQWDLNHNPHAF